MNRTFQSKVKWHQIVFLLIITGLCIYMIWIKQSILATLLSIMLIIIIEKIIHTEYTLTTDNELIIKKGRFSKKRIVNLDEIIDIEIKTSTKVGSKYLYKYILLTTKDNNYIGLTPANVESFYKTILRKKESYID